MDSYGQALLDFYHGQKRAKIKVESDVAETEYWPVSEFFHTEKEMSQIEMTALELCTGRVLDVGAGSGSHVLWLQEHGVDAYGIDTSAGAVKVMTERGAKNVRQADFYQLSGEKYDTLLMLMNGFGIAQSMQNLPRFFAQVSNLLAAGGKLIADSADLLPLFASEDGSVLINLNDNYHGELQYVMSYKGQRGEPFPWLFIDFDTLQMVAAQHGFVVEKLTEDDNNQFLFQCISNT